MRGRRGFRSSQYYFRLNEDIVTQVEPNEPVVVVQGDDLADAVVRQDQCGELLEVSEVADPLKFVCV